MIGALRFVTGLIPLKAWLAIAGVALAGAVGWYGWHTYHSAIHDAADARQAAEQAQERADEQQLLANAWQAQTERLIRAVEQRQQTLQDARDDIAEKRQALEALHDDDSDYRQWADQPVPDAAADWVRKLSTPAGRDAGVPDHPVISDDAATGADS